MASSSSSSSVVVCVGVVGRCIIFSGGSGSVSGRGCCWLCWCCGLVVKGIEILIEELDCDAVQNDCQGDVFAFCIHILGICLLLDPGILVVSLQTAES